MRGSRWPRKPTVRAKRVARIARCRVAGTAVVRSQKVVQKSVKLVCLQGSVPPIAELVQFLESRLVPMKNLVNVHTGLRQSLIAELNSLERL